MLMMRKTAYCMAKHQNLSSIPAVTSKARVIFLSNLCGASALPLRRGVIATSCVHDHVHLILHEGHELLQFCMLASFISLSTDARKTLSLHQRKEVSNNINGRALVSAWKLKQLARRRINSCQRCNKTSNRPLVEEGKVDMPSETYWKLSRVHTYGLLGSLVAPAMLQTLIWPWPIMFWSKCRGLWPHLK